MNGLNAHLIGLLKNQDVTVAYTFSATPPFGVVSVSRPLPLQGAGAAFPSALLFPHHSGGAGPSDKAVVGYGVANAESRALVVSVDFFEALFSPELT